LEVEMPRFILAELVGVGLPPRVVESREPLGFIDGLLVVVVVALAFWLSVRFVAWVETRVELWELLREIRREYRRNRPPPRHTDSQ
jgi:hypothetical protein